MNAGRPIVRLATVSGSFRRAMPNVQEAVHELTDMGVRVLSPADPRVVDAFGEFLFVASDRMRTIRLVQNRHLAAIAASDFLWLVAPEGYIGVSASMEIGYATAIGTPIFSTTPPSDLTLRQYVEVVPSIAAALRRLEGSADLAQPAILLDPDSGVERAHRHLEVLRKQLTGTPSLTDDEAARRNAAAVRSAVKGI